MTVKLRNLLLTAAVAGAMFFAGRGCGGGDGGGSGFVKTRVDTVFVRDTLRETTFVPVERLVVRVDTVWLPTVSGASTSPSTPTHADSAQIAIPIERKVYRTADYRAVVEGFRPELTELEIYRNTAFITKSPQPQRWSLGLQTGWGFSPKGTGPYLGVGIQYRLLAW